MSLGLSLASFPSSSPPHLSINLSSFIILSLVIIVAVSVVLFSGLENTLSNFISFNFSFNTLAWLIPVWFKDISLCPWVLPSKF